MIFLYQGQNNVVLRVREHQKPFPFRVTAAPKVVLDLSPYGDQPSVPAGMATAVMPNTQKTGVLGPKPQVVGWQVTAVLQLGTPAYPLSHLTLSAELDGPNGYPVNPYVAPASNQLWAGIPYSKNYSVAQRLDYRNIALSPAQRNHVLIPQTGATIHLPPTGIIEFVGEAAVHLTAQGTAKHGVAAQADLLLALVADGAAFHDTAGAAEGSGAAVLQLIASGQAAHGESAVGQVTLDVTLEAQGLAAHGVSAHGQAVLALDAESSVDHAVGARGTAALTMQAFGHGQHIRYEVRGQVRETAAGLLMNRRVRVCSRATGQLVGQQDSIGGYFRVHCGIQPEEYVIYSVDPTGMADEFKLPAQNRVISVLAQDVA